MPRASPEYEAQRLAWAREDEGEIVAERIEREVRAEATVGPLADEQRSEVRSAVGQLHSEVWTIHHPVEVV